MTMPAFLPVVPSFKLFAGVAAHPANPRPTVHLQGDISQQVAETLKQLDVVNTKAQRLFRQRGTIVRRTQNPDTQLTIIESVHDLTSLSTELGQLLRFTAKKGNLTGPPEAVVRAILKSDAISWKLPVLEKVVHAPFFDANGKFIQEQGYHSEQRVWLDTGSLKVPTVSAVPSLVEVHQAHKWIQSLLQDCQFSDLNSRNNAIAALITPHIRDMIAEHIPMVLIMAERPGAGKTTLAQIIGKLVKPGPVPTLPEATSEEEWRKRILSVLRGQPSVVFVDNLNQPLDSSPLAGLITLEVFQDRALGGNQIESHPNRALWMFTANNPQVSPELQRRTCLVRLGSISAIAQNRSYFHDDLYGWMECHRGQLLWAIFTLVQFWVASGKPKGNVHEKGMRRFSEVLGGILDVTGYGDVLANMDEVRAETGRGEEDTLAMLHEWLTAFGTTEVTASQIGVLLEKNQLYPNDLSSHKANIVGQMLKKMTGYIAHGHVLRHRIDASNHRAKYRLEALPV